MVWWGGNEAGHPGDTAAFWQHTATVTGPLVKALKADDGEVGGRGVNQLSQLTPPIATGGLRCFSFFEFYLHDSYISLYGGNTSWQEIASWMNCPSFGPVFANGSISDAMALSEQLWSSGHKQWPLWKVADTQIYTYPCSKVACGSVAMSGLVPDWEARIDAMVAIIKTMPDYAARTVGFDLGDELLADGTTLANVTAVVRRIRAQWSSDAGEDVGASGLTFYLNENGFPFDKGDTGLPCRGSSRCAASPDPLHGCCLNGPEGVPSEIDWISVDDYAGTCSPGPKGACTLAKLGSPCPHPPTDARCSCWGIPPEQEASGLFAYLRKSVYPHLNAAQRVFVVPGIFGSAPLNATEELAAEDAMLTVRPLPHFNMRALPTCA